MMVYGYYKYKLTPLLDVMEEIGGTLCIFDEISKYKQLESRSINSSRD
ncbi:MAG: hypothetical protein ACFFD4_17980 [Candidatus Odinarchaeota archaeon]